MKKLAKDNNIQNSIVSNKHFENLVKISLIIGILVVSGFIIYFILSPEPGKVTFGILNENQEAGDFQTEASVNETITFYLSVENRLNKDFTFRFKIKKGSNETILSSSGSNGTLYLTYGNFTLEPNEMQIYGEYNISFEETGVDVKIIAELWKIYNEVEEYFNIIYLKLNITN
ncbi:MAG: hypothetical protein ACFE9Z_02505 [Promethearchaeota archaeon]